MANSIAKYKDAGTRPPKGGWHYFLPDGSRVEAYSEGELIEQIRKWQVNNNRFVSVEAIEADVWNYLCSLDPRRCGYRHASPTPMRGPAVQREVTKELQGPSIWTFLNTLAVQWTPALHSYFRDTIAAIGLMLVCPDCRREWLRVVAEFPPYELSTRLAVCQWVNTVHNAVNARIGKNTYPYSRMVNEWGAPSE